MMRVILTDTSGKLCCITVQECCVTRAGEADVLVLTDLDGKDIVVWVGLAAQTYLERLAEKEFLDLRQYESNVKFDDIDEYGNTYCMDSFD